ncbi:MAG: type II toxin-antitoxin system RelE family toxin [Roseiarcus sp.]
MLRIELSKQAADFLRAAQAKPARQIAEKLKQLAADPSALPSEVLKGYAPLRRVKSGEFRIIFRVDSDTVRVSLIGKRNDDDIYKALERTWKK